MWPLCWSLCAPSGGRDRWANVGEAPSGECVRAAYPTAAQSMRPVRMTRQTPRGRNAIATLQRRVLGSLQHLGGHPAEWNYGSVEPDRMLDAIHRAMLDRAAANPLQSRCNWPGASNLSVTSSVYTTERRAHSDSDSSPTPFAWPERRCHVVTTQILRPARLSSAPLVAGRSTPKVRGASRAFFYRKVR